MVEEVGPADNPTHASSLDLPAEHINDENNTVLETTSAFPSFRSSLSGLELQVNKADGDTRLRIPNLGRHELCLHLHCPPAVLFTCLFGFLPLGLEFEKGELR